jgi:hypothetical protein
MAHHAAIETPRSPAPAVGALAAPGTAAVPTSSFPAITPPAPITARSIPVSDVENHAARMGQAWRRRRGERRRRGGCHGEQNCSSGKCRCDAHCKLSYRESTSRTHMSGTGGRCLSSAEWRMNGFVGADTNPWSANFPIRSISLVRCSVGIRCVESEDKSASIDGAIRKQFSGKARWACDRQADAPTENEPSDAGEAVSEPDHRGVAAKHFRCLINSQFGNQIWPLQSNAV